MAYLFKLDNVIFLSKIGTANNSAGEFAALAGPLPEITSSAKALENYRQRFMALNGVLHLYKQLLLQDIGTMKMMGAGLQQADESLGNSILRKSILP